MKFRDFVMKMTADELENYAKEVGTTAGYLKSHLLYGYKEPRRKLRKALSTHSNGQVSEAEVLEHFGVYPDNNGINQNGNKSFI